MKKLTIFIFILAGLVAVITVRNSFSNSSALEINSERVKEQVLSDSILASGNLIFDSQIEIRSEVTGIVTELSVEEGQYIDKGAQLLQLDATAYIADVQKFESAVKAQEIEIEYAEEISRDLQRQLETKRELYKNNSLGLETLKQIESEHRVARIKVEAAKESLNQQTALLAYAQDRLKKTTFRAAMSGLVSSVDVKTGETVIASTTNILGSSLITLADPTTILAELRIDEADRANVKHGQTVNIFTASDPKTGVEGRVKSIGTSARSENGNKGLFYIVKVELENQEQLFPGMSCRAEIVTSTSNPSLSVPISAVRKENEDYFVWVIDDDTVKKQTVTVGMATDTQQSITSGLQLLDVVVTGPSRLFSQFKDGIGVKQKDNHL
ncbi:efflux RND transporter periplasmic adaptor subunit [Aliiglaciecola sp. LCG003]|uniref:efflux RND transporter periplasmic adaptor subunit n=1 Tax=Aliiglaciecola sp. LCG003 TaxID=3053655 RepID=UPI0025745AA8|nr:efflux RND transporter periplasmic adaptor subunit [Aliiglaciecola sp. LCG003]WJG11194.1 efflux RND transporter periplasmic adaptor subunit [Aliiglaciecola sp. LCG003]